MQSIQVKRLAATNHKPTRYKAFTEKFYAISSESARDALQKLIDKLHWKGTMQRGSLPNGDDVYVFIAPNDRIDAPFQVAPAMGRYEIREGNGNDGEYHRGYQFAANAFDALRQASRRGMICKPRDAKLADIDGDDQQAHLASFVAPIYGDACRWTASASLVD